MKESGANALPERLQVSIGGHFGTSFSVELEGDLLVYQYSKPKQQFPPEWDSRSERIQPSEERWQAFRASLDRLDVWRWQPEYFEPVCDGTGWSAEIVYLDKSIRAAGSNCFPGHDGSPIAITDYLKDGTFTKFCHAVSTLVGRKFV